MLFTNSVSYNCKALGSANVRFGEVDSQFDQFRLQDKGKSFIGFKFDIPCHVHVCYVHVNLSHRSISPSDVSVSLYVNEKLFRGNFKVCGQNRFVIPPKLLRRGENWFKLRLNTGSYGLSKIKIKYRYFHPDDITYVEKIDATTSELKKYDFPESERTATCNYTKISDFVLPDGKYAEFNEPGQSSIVMNFDVPDYTLISRIKLTLTHCVTSDDVVVNIFVNNCPLRLMYSLSEKNSSEEVTFIVGKQFFKSGSNTVTINLTSESQGFYRLSQAILGGIHTSKPCDHESELQSRNTTLVRDLIQFIDTRAQVFKIFERIASEFQELERLTDEVEKTRSASEMFVSLLCLSVDALGSISAETNTSIIYFKEENGSAVIRVEIDAKESNTDITREMNDTVEIREAQMYFEQDDSITRSVFNNVEQLLRLPRESNILAVWSKEEPDVISTTIKNFIESPSKWLSRELNIEAGESLNLPELISTITKLLKKPSAVAGMLYSWYYMVMFGKDYNFKNLTRDYFGAMLSNLRDIVDEPSARGLHSVLCYARTFHGFEGRDLSWINWLQHLNDDDFGDLENKVFRIMWSKLEECEIDHSRVYIDIFVVSHGTIGAPEDGRYRFNAPVYHDVQQLLFEINNELVFYAPWGVSMDPRAVASIVDGTIDLEECIIYEEPDVNSEKKISVTAEEFTDRPDKWNILSRQAPMLNEAIPTVWLNAVDKTLDSKDSIDSMEDKHDRIFLTYRSNIPCPLPVITAVLSLFFEAHQLGRIIRSEFRIHHAASLGWPNNRDEIPRELQFIRQYHSSLSYFQQHGKRLWMTHRPDAESN